MKKIQTFFNVFITILYCQTIGISQGFEPQWAPPTQPRSIEVVTSAAQAEATEFISLLINPKNLTKEGVKTFAVARALYREGYFVECQQMLKSFWNTYPRNLSDWGQQAENVGYKLGYPCTYPALLMLTRAVDWRIKAQGLPTPAVPTDWNIVALIPQGGSGFMPSNATEAAAGTGTPVSKAIEPELLANDYAILHDVMWIIREYYLAMTEGKIHLRLTVQQMPDVNFSLRHSSGTGDRNADYGKLRPAIPPEIFQKADLFWLVYPTIFPPEGSSSPYYLSWYGPSTSSGGMGVFPSSTIPMLMGEDVAMTNRPFDDGHGPVHSLGRQIYIPYWVQHEFFHDHYRSNKHLNLEVESHQWFDRSKWPADFVGNYEPDYYDESMIKRLQDQAEPSGAGFFITRCAPLFSPLVTEAEVMGKYEISSPTNNWNYGEIKKVNGQLKWVNRAGASWDLTLQPGGYFETGSGNPYRIYGATTFDPFPVRMADGLPSQKTVGGFRFGVDNFLRKPFVPSKLIATASAQGVNLDWADNRDSEFSSYRVYRSTTTGSYGAPIATGLTSSQYSDTTAVNGTTYYYTVTAIDADSAESPHVNEVSFTPYPIAEIQVKATDNSFVLNGNGVQTVTETLGIKRDTWTTVSRFAYLRFPLVSDNEIGGVPIHKIASVTLDVQVTGNQAGDTLNVYALMEQVQASSSYLKESSWTGGVNGTGGNLQASNRPDGQFALPNGCSTVKLGSYTFADGTDIGVKSIPITSMDVFRNLIKYDKNGQITLIITGSSMNLTPSYIASVFNTNGHLVPTLKINAQSHTILPPVSLEKARWETFSHTFTASGGTVPYTWDEVSVEGLPPGLTLSPQGVLSGAVTSSAKKWQLVIQATDSKGCIHKAPFALNVINAPPIVNAGADRTVIVNLSPWTPALTSPLAWYDATDTATILQSSNYVSEWKSKIGTSHMLQTSSTKQPITGSKKINGLNAISFDGTDDALKTAINPFGGSIQNAMIMGAFNIGTISASTLFSLSGSDGARWQAHAPYSGGDIYFDCAGASGANRLQISSGWSASQNKLLGFYCSLTDNVQQIWDSGNLKKGDTTGHSVSVSSGIALGNNGASDFDNCTMGEIVILSGVVNTYKRQILEGYLAHKWGFITTLPTDHPYKVSPPASGTVINLSGISSSDPDNDPLAYTWSVIGDSTNIVIFDTSSKDTSLYVKAFGSYVLRLTVSDGYSQTSDDITIHVGDPAPYLTWTNGTFSRPFTLTGTMEDPDHDGMINLLEYAFGMDPTRSAVELLIFVPDGNMTSTGPPLLSITQGPPATYSAIFARRKNHATAGISYNTQFSADMKAWTASETGLVVVSHPNSSGDLEVVSVPFPSTVPIQGGGSANPKFFRVAITEN